MKKYTLKELLEESASSQTLSKMTELKIQNIIKESDDYEVLEEEKGYVLFTYLGKKIALLSDEVHNRMRIISPITEYSSLAPKIKDSLMSSNFSTTLDARYSVNENTLFAAFMHPLSSLHKEDFLSAIKQVYNLNANFAKTYSSAQIQFTGKK